MTTHAPRPACLIAKLLTTLACMALCIAITPSRATAQGSWESLSQSELIPRSERIVIGRLWHRGKPDEDGYTRAQIRVDETIYSGVGEDEWIDLRVATETVPGTSQEWRDKTYGIWFILEHDDPYAPLDHPSCFADESQANRISTMVASGLNDKYRGTLSAMTAAQKKYPEATSRNSSSSQQSVAAYTELTGLVAAIGSVPNQDPQQQTNQTYGMVIELLEAAGTTTSLPAEVSDAEAEEALYESFTKLLAPIEERLGGLPPLSQNPAIRGAQVQLAQRTFSQLGLQLLRSTMAANDPDAALAELDALPIDVAKLRSLRPGGDRLRRRLGSPVSPDEPVALPLMLRGLASDATREELLQQALKKLGAAPSE